MNKEAMGNKACPSYPLNGQLSKQMTKELFEEINAWDEVKGWFETIKRLLNATVQTR